ncbi:MAG: YceI family protein [Flavobacteriales bacterium]|nr:YceI family protein [Flavobacteriales bacterium]
MKNTILLSAVALIISLPSAAQKFGTKAGHINFYSSTKVEDIKADNHAVNAVLDASTGDLQFAALIKSFEFEKALMQEHFNENYMESSTYPKAQFKGKVNDMSAVNLKKDGTYPAKATGDLTMHGVTKNITIDTMYKVTGGKVSAESKFYVNPKDYNISIPEVVKDKISGNIEVTVKVNLDELPGK